jgi:hypothetical protein
MERNVKNVNVDGGLRGFGNRIIMRRENGVVYVDSTLHRTDVRVLGKEMGCVPSMWKGVEVKSLNKELNFR